MSKRQKPVRLQGDVDTLAASKTLPFILFHCKKEKHGNEGFRLTLASFLNNLYSGVPAVGDILSHADNGEMQQPTRIELTVEMVESCELYVHYVNTKLYTSAEMYVSRSLNRTSSSQCANFDAIHGMFI